MSMTTNYPFANKLYQHNSGPQGRGGGGGGRCILQGIDQEREKFCILHELGNKIQLGVWSYSTSLVGEQGTKTYNIQFETSMIKPFEKK